MDEKQLIAEGYYSTFGNVGARTEIPGCSLCMGNQARVADKSTVVSTSTRNFPNRLGKGANVFLSSAELAAITAIEGELPSVEKYQEYAAKINESKVDTFRYLNFDRLGEYVEGGKTAEMGAEYKTVLDKEIERLRAQKV
jgi:aconitate hydratase 2/2-methylisocitrate dehydratase